MDHHVGTALRQPLLSFLFGKALDSAPQFGNQLRHRGRSSINDPGRNLNAAIRTPECENVSRKNRRRKQHHVNLLGFSTGGVAAVLAVSSSLAGTLVDRCTL